MGKRWRLRVHSAFHDTSSFLNIVSREVPDISAEATVYLDEAVAAYFAGCLLGVLRDGRRRGRSGVLRLVDVAANSPTFGSTFVPVVQPIFIRQKITKFQECRKLLLDARRLPREAVEDLETNFNMTNRIVCLQYCEEWSGGDVIIPPSLNGGNKVDGSF